MAVSLQAGGAGVGDSCKRLLSVFKTHTNTPAIWPLTVSPELVPFALSALESLRKKLVTTGLESQGKMSF